GHGAEAGDAPVPAPGAGQESDDVGPHGVEVHLPAVADPLPVPGFGAGTSARFGPAGVVPPESGGVGLEPPVADGAEPEAPRGVLEVDRLAPAVHRRAGPGGAGAVPPPTGVVLGRR